MENSKGKFLNHNSARTEEQKKLMAQIEQDGVCPFCADYFTKYHPKPILKETEYWFVSENMSPYEGTKHHLIFVYKPDHIASPKDISPKAQQNLFELISWAIEEFDIEGGSFFMRFGNTTYNGSSVEHLHAHLISGSSQTEHAEAIRVKLGWRAS